MSSPPSFGHGVTPSLSLATAKNGSSKPLDPFFTADPSSLPLSPESDGQFGAAWPYLESSESPATRAMAAIPGNTQDDGRGQITPPDDAWAPDGWPVDGPSALTTRGATGATQKSRKSAAGGKVDKRDKYREKNRVAAAKCRAKKKEHIDGLEDNHRTQSMLHSLLKQEAQNLRDELSFWRTQALQHGFCDCKAIQDYNMRKARDLAVQQEGELGRQDMVPGGYSASDFDSPSNS